jgi:hypothetical protein
MADRELESVEPSALTCEQVDEQDLEAAYLAGRLAEPAAEAFEAHLFACDRCWDLVQTARAVAGASSHRRAAVGRRRWRLGVLAPLAAAAGIATVLLVRWPLAGGTGGPDSGALRGGGDALPVTAAVRGRQMTAAWPRVAGAEVYQLRLYAPDGGVLLQSETLDTLTVLVLDSSPLVGQVGTVYWQVQALDPLRQPLARSALTPVELSAR